MGISFCTNWVPCLCDILLSTFPPLELYSLRRLRFEGHLFDSCPFNILQNDNSGCKHYHSHFIMYFYSIYYKSISAYIVVFLFWNGWTHFSLHTILHKERHDMLQDYAIYYSTGCEIKRTKMFMNGWRVIIQKWNSKNVTCGLKI